MLQSTASYTITPPALNDCEILDAGYVQRREWTAYKIREDHYPFSTSIHFLVDSFDPILFQKTINAIVERHEILRTTLRVIDGSLKQVIHPPKNFIVRFAYHDISQQDKTDDAKNGFIDSKVEAAIQMPFNFELGPLFRAIVFKKDKNKHAIYFVLHHVVFDLHSFDIFKEDITRIWKMQCNQFFQPLSKDPVQYKEMASYENDLLNSQKGEAHERFWKSRLSEGIPRLQIIDEDRWAEHERRYALIVDEVRSRMKQLDFCDESTISGVLRKYRAVEGGYMIYRYDENVFQGIKQYTASGKNGLLTLLFASLALTFHELSGQRRFAFDTPGSSRSNTKFKNTIGWLTTGGPCFVSIPENGGAQSFMDLIDKELYLLSKHCIYPFETIGSKYPIPLGGSMPVFFTLINKNENIPVDKFGILQGTAQGSVAYQDIAFFFYMFNDAISVSVGYDNLIFDWATVENFMKVHERMLGNIIKETLENQSA